MTPINTAIVRLACRATRLFPFSGLPGRLSDRGGCGGRSGAVARPSPIAAGPAIAPAVGCRSMASPTAPLFIVAQTGERFAPLVDPVARRRTRPARPDRCGAEV